MTRILDRIARTLKSEFRPASPDEYFALRLAHRLGEPEAAVHYAILASRYPQPRLLCAFEKAVADENSEQTLGRRFHENLDSVGKHGNGEAAPRHQLLAIRVERRTIAVAVFDGIRLEGRRVLQLSSNPDRAESSAIGFIRRLLAEVDCTSAAIEPPPRDQDVLRAAIHRSLVSEIKSRGISLWEISAQTLFGAFGHPALKNRPELRQVMLSIWPLSGLKATHWCALDAFAIGLFVQTERLFNNF
jgi:hypothetical protein